MLRDPQCPTAYWRTQVEISQIESTSGTINDHANKCYTVRSDDDMDAALKTVSENLDRIGVLKTRLTNKGGAKRLAALEARFSQDRDLMAQLRVSPR